MGYKGRKGDVAAVSNPGVASISILRPCNINTEEASAVGKARRISCSDKGRLLLRFAFFSLAAPVCGFLAGGVVLVPWRSPKLLGGRLTAAETFDGGNFFSADGFVSLLGSFVFIRGDLLAGSIHTTDLFVPCFFSGTAASPRFLGVLSTVDAANVTDVLVGDDAVVAEVLVDSLLAGAAVAAAWEVLFPCAAAPFVGCGG